MPLQAVVVAEVVVVEAEAEEVVRKVEVRDFQWAPQPPR